LGKFFSNIVTYFNKHIVVYFAVLLTLVAVLYFGFSRLKLDDNIYSIFPQGEEFKEFNSVLKENNLNKQIVFSIDANNLSSDELLSQLDTVSAELTRATGDLIESLEYYREDQESVVLAHFYDFFPAYLNQSDYKSFDGKLKSDSIAKSIAGASERLTSVNSFFLRKIIAKDPLGLAWTKLRDLNPQSDEASFQVEDGLLYSSDRSKVIFNAILGFELDDNVSNAELNKKLEAFRENINKDSDYNFDFFGTFQISYANSKQVQSDTFITMLLSVGLILLLLIVYYRSLLTPIYFVLPALFSGFSGLALVGYIQPNISAISVATSAVLMGIVLDYSFHFFTHYKHSGSLIESVKELSFPMLVGSFTTVAAFSALMFTDSVVLQNFGLISLCTLSSAVLFTLLLLPTFLKLVRFKANSKGTKTRSNPIPRIAFRIAIYGVILTTVFFIFRSSQFQFDSDLNNLSYHSQELIDKEEFYTGINPKEEKKLHLFISSTSKSEAIRLNFELFEGLSRFRAKHGLEELISTGPYLIPPKVIKDRGEVWNSYWEKHIDSTMTEIRANAVKYDFSEKAFNPFESWVRMDVPLENNEELLSDLGLNRFIYQTDKGWNLITSVVLDRSELDLFKTEFSQYEGVYIFDVAEMANALMISVQNDFNYLLLFSSLVVLISLLVIYGRVELALFSFLPMVISWVWILAIAGMFDIQFNFVNIIVATFIFGLGDDFSIFVTDGLIQKYKTKSDSLKSYRSAIILSGITTIIGTGALYFAKHPAIHSIAIISVVGIGCIMLVTLLIQPAIFEFFVTNRTSKKKSPVTLLGLLISLFLFTYFFIGCIFINLFLLLLIPFPAPKKSKRKLLNFIVSKLAKSTIYLGFHTKKKIINSEKLNFDKPSIIVANHSSFLDILLMIMLNPKVIIMVKKWVYNSPVFGLFIRYSGYLFIAEGTEYNMELIQSRVNDGYSIMIFPEGTRSTDGQIKRFHKGAFYLAQELKLDIQPILIVGANYVNAKNDFIIKSGSLILVVLDRITPGQEIYNQRFGLFTKSVLSLMRSEYKQALNEHANAKYLKRRVEYNYLYKSPITEWYVKIKWQFEAKNFEYYDNLIQDRKRIIDIGCGLGYLGYYLHYRNEDRIITGVDYDEDKIAVAQNGYDKTDHLNFESKDLREVVFDSPDVVFFNDVLHYISLDDQFAVLKKVADALNENGLLFIRDGITDLSDRHAVTQRTEKYSTQIVNFNKTSGDLSFFSSKDIFKFAEEHHFDCEMIEQSEKTSNVLFVLRKTTND